MTKQSIVSILKNISDSYSIDNTNTVTTFRISDTVKSFSVRITIGTIYCGTIYCDCIRIDDNSELIQFLDNGIIIAIFNYLAIEEINLL